MWPASTLIVLLVIAGVAAAILFLPVNPVAYKQTKTAPAQADVTALELDFTADVASVNIYYQELVDSLIVLNVSATGSTNIFAAQPPINVTFTHAVAGSTLHVASQIHRNPAWTWQFGLNVVCNLYIDPSMSLDIDVKTTVGTITMNSKAGLVFDRLDLETTTGSIGTKFGQNVTLKGDARLETTTGGISLETYNLKTSSNIHLRVTTTTGGVNINATQTTLLPANVTLNAQATTGGITLKLTIANNVAAKITYQTTIGGTTLNKQGFTGTDSPIQSTNYPAAGNINADLKTTTGGISINATYAP